MINRKKTAKEIVKRYIKSEKSLNFVIGTEGEKKLKEAQGKSKYDGMLKQIKGETEDTLHHLFSELKELVWNDMEMHFLKFIKDKWKIVSKWVPSLKERSRFKDHLPNTSCQHQGVPRPPTPHGTTKSQKPKRTQKA